MAEPADRPGLVLVITRNLHAAHRVHGLEVLEELGLVRLGGRRGLVAQVGRVRARELDGDGGFGEGASRRARGRRAANSSTEHCGLPRLWLKEVAERREKRRQSSVLAAG